MLKKILLYYLLFPISIFSQNKNYKFEHVSVDHNLFHYSVNSIFQDRTGFLWIGTRSGLNIFDGYSFRSFKSSNEENSISSDVIKKIFEDRDGDLWIGTGGGLNKYNKESKTFIRYRNIKNNQNSISDNSINDIIEDKNGYLWIATNNGLCRFDKKNGTFKNYFNKKDDINSIQSNYVTSLLIDNQGNLWIGTKDLFLDYIIFDENSNLLKGQNAQNLRIFHYQIKFSKPSEIDQVQITKIFQDKSNKFWIGTNILGLFSFEFNNLDRISKNNSNSLNLLLSNLNGSRKDNNKISNTEIRDIIEDKYGNLWIGTFGGGSYIFNYRENKMTTCKHELTNSNSINNDYICSIFEDRSGNIWLGTYSGGLNKYSPYKNNFTLYRNDPSDLSSPRNNFISSIFVDDEGICWLGTREGLNKLDRKSKKSIIYSNNPKDPLSLSNNIIRSLDQDEFGNLWIGTRGGLNCFDKKLNKFKKFNPNLKNVLSKTVIRALLYDDGFLWIGAMSGLYKLNLKTDSFICFSHDDNDPSSINASYVWSIYEDRNKNLWIGTISGINRFNPKNNSFKKYVFPTDKKSIPAENPITSINEDQTGVIWISTYAGGVFKLEPKNNMSSKESEFDLVNYDNSMINNEGISGILIDNKNELWLGTDKGIMKVSSDRKNIRIYDYRDGVIENEFNTGSVFKDKNNEFFIGGNNGMVTFFPDKILENKNPPNIVLTSFSKLDSIIYSGTQVALVKEIELSYKENIFSFIFSSLDLTQPMKNEYFYKIDGYNEDWINSGNKNEVSYMNLSGGDYIFKVKGSNNDGIFSDELSIKLKIVPPIWERFWFKIFFVLILGASIILYLRNRISGIVKQKNVLSKLVEERTYELKKTNELLSDSIASKDKLFSILSHDLKGPVGNVANMLKIIASEDEFENIDKKEILPSIIETLDNSYILLENLLDWARTQKGNFLLNFEVYDLSSIVESVLDLMKGIAKSKSITIITDIDKSINVFCDLNTTSTVIRNLTSNAIKFSPHNSVIKISGEKKDEKNIIISIKDNGVGIEPEKLEQLFKTTNTVSTTGTGGEKGTGLGIMVCMDFVQKNNGVLWAKSQINNGTTFYFTLPISNSD